MKVKPPTIPDIELKQQDTTVSRSVESTKYRWSPLNRQQIGRYAEYYVMMEFTLYGFEVYSSEVDDRGIDFVVRRASGQFYEVQVKSIRNSKYILFPKSKFQLRNNLLAAVVIFNEGKMPDLYIIRSTKWEEPGSFLVSRDYKGKKSAPEWGINLSAKNLPNLEQYRFDNVVEFL